MLSLLFHLVTLPAPKPVRQEAPAKYTIHRASYLVTVADDFVVEVYKNGKAIPDSRRQLLEERFGATVEKINVAVDRGDWLVFHVVNNKMRWGGSAYFAVAGCFSATEHGFGSNLEDGNWSVCDTPQNVNAFIESRSYMAHQSARPPARPWQDGDPLIKQYAGEGWKGSAVWGTSSSTWVKVLVD